MAYTPTAWVDGVTPVNAANLNKIETGLDLVDAFVGTGPDLTIPGDMTVQGGDVNIGADVNLYRQAADVIATDDTLNLNRGSGAPALRAYWAKGDAFPGWQLDRNGDM